MSSPLCNYGCTDLEKVADAGGHHVGFFQLAKIDAGTPVFTVTVILMHLLHAQFSQRHVSQTCTTGYAVISLTNSGTIEHYEASTAFWLRENAGHSNIFAAPFRVTIGRRTCSGSVAGLQIVFATGMLMGGARESQTELILSKRHLKHFIKEIPCRCTITCPPCAGVTQPHSFKAAPRGVPFFLTAHPSGNSIVP